MGTFSTKFTTWVDAFVTTNVPATPIMTKKSKKTIVTDSFRLILLFRCMNRISGLSAKAVISAIIKGTETGNIKIINNKNIILRKMSDHWRFEIERSKLIQCLLSLALLV